MTGSYYDTGLKARIRPGGTGRADRWSGLDQNDQSSATESPFLPLSRLIHLEERNYDF